MSSRSKIGRERGVGLKQIQLPEPTIVRLTRYARCLTDLLRHGVKVVSSDSLAGQAGVNAAQVRKDLSYLGSFGRRGVGYDTKHLLDRISIALGLTKERSVVIVGVGKLGSALIGYNGFRDKGFKGVAAFDNDPDKLGTKIGEIKILPFSELVETVQRYDVEIGIVTVPADYAQSVTDDLVNAGIKSILNFAPVVVKVPSSVILRQVDLSSELEILSHYLDNRDI